MSAAGNKDGEVPVTSSSGFTGRMAWSGLTIDRLRVLPFQFWGLHPLYYADVRMLCAHVERCVSSIDPGTEQCHILYGQHPITKVEIAGTVTDASLRGGERLAFTVDDGTGAVQCVIFLTNFLDKRPSLHYRPKVGESVVVVGKLGFGFRLGAVADRCREVTVRRIRLAVSEDELPAHWANTMVQHASIYCKPARELMPPRVLPGSMPMWSLIPPLSQAAVALQSACRPAASSAASEAAGTTATAPAVSGGAGAGASATAAAGVLPAARHREVSGGTTSAVASASSSAQLLKPANGTARAVNSASSAAVTGSAAASAEAAFLSGARAAAAADVDAAAGAAARGAGGRLGAAASDQAEAGRAQPPPAKRARRSDPDTLAADAARGATSIAGALEAADAASGASSGSSGSSGSTDSSESADGGHLWLAGALQQLIRQLHPHCEEDRQCAAAHEEADSQQQDPAVAAAADNSAGAEAAAAASSSSAAAAPPVGPRSRSSASSARQALPDAFCAGDLLLALPRHESWASIREISFPSAATSERAATADTRRAEERPVSHSSSAGAGAGAPVAAGGDDDDEEANAVATVAAALQQPPARVHKLLQTVCRCLAALETGGVIYSCDAVAAAASAAARPPLTAKVYVAPIRSASSATGIATAAPTSTGTASATGAGALLAAASFSNAAPLRHPSVAQGAKQQQQLVRSVTFRERFLPVSMERVLLPALVAILQKQPPTSKGSSAAARAPAAAGGAGTGWSRSGAGAGAGTSSTAATAAAVAIGSTQEGISFPVWTHEQLMAALSGDVRTRRVLRSRAQEALRTLLSRGRLVAAGPFRYSLEYESSQPALSAAVPGAGMHDASDSAAGSAAAGVASAAGLSSVLSSAAATSGAIASASTGSAGAAAASGSIAPSSASRGLPLAVGRRIDEDDDGSSLSDSGSTDSDSSAGSADSFRTVDARPAVTTAKLASKESRPPAAAAAGLPPKR